MSPRRAGPRVRALAARVAAAGAWPWALALSGLALVVRLPFFFGRHRIPAQTDGAYYAVLANDLLHHQSFPGEHFYTPGYPAFMALMQLLPGRREDVIIIGQHLLGVAVVAALVVLGWRHFGRAPALLAATLAAATPVLVAIEHDYKPDLLFGVVILAGALALAEAARRPRPELRWPVVTGLLFGLATWNKPSGQFLVLAPPLALLLATRDIRRTLTASAVVALVLLVTISPWLVRNTRMFGYASMSNQGGMTLFNRAFDVDHLPIPTDSPEGRFAAEVAARPARRPHPLPLFQSFHDAEKAERGITSDAAIALEYRLARTAIRRHAGAYLANTWRGVRRAVRDVDRFEGSPALLAELDTTRPPFPRSALARVWHAARALSDVWWVLSLNAVAGLLVVLFGRPPERQAGAALLSVWLVVLVGTVLSHGQLWRYSVEVAPITWLLGSAGLVFVVSSVMRRIARR